VSPQLKTNTLGLDSILSAANLASGLSRYPQEFLMAAKTRAVLTLLVGAVTSFCLATSFLNETG
ncbi:MAG: hypothetical protein ACLPTZ_08345, partial [Beijerinckiaceae bacterium]